MSVETIPVNHKPANELWLVNGLLKRNEQAFNFLYQHYGRALYGIILRLVKCEEEAEDILQETFLNISRSIAGYDSDKSRLFTWMARIARNKALDHLRSSYHRHSDREFDTSELQDCSAKNGSVNYNTDTIGIRQLTNALSATEQEIIYQIYFLGYTQAEVAIRLDIPLGTVKTRIRKSIYILRKHFLPE